MIIDAQPLWAPILLALVLLGDILMSIRPLPFIEKCLRGVNLPRQWWWILIYIKTLAVAGLTVGIWIPGVGIATTAAVVAYFIAAAIAHIKAKFLGTEFWLNCLGMLALSIVVLGVMLYS
ncbi:hypothetical protein EML15_09575 [Corynebacterium sp. sy017]|uniref:DoxX family protein n=1 Tax=unclassified Corynebacterium TaxID=2624378 RepID=UPI001184D15C|nr:MULTISPECIES: DoxX family protein [unclassified Corynebacterium]MBP3089387.1 hypothetical protein [Corynebacterium sp. sy017]QDZ43315.1 hypothetical protein FQV43_09260 [Corynebacterium sp. sy039]TSD90922.1 hypothetical protein ELY17_09025 [Corynebacterium sp. SY003]